MRHAAAARLGRRQRRLLLFGLAFAVLAVNRIGLALLDDESEAGTFVYAARALAFALIVAAIVDKNRAPRG